jgi:transcription-repair coupling factor (superfamily II helicase)
MIEMTARLHSKERKVVVAPYTSLMTNFPDYTEMTEGKFRMKIGESINPMQFFEQLIEKGYEVCDDQYLEKGTYHRSGDLLSIFPVNFDHPVKVEIGFDAIEKIYTYDQESKETLEELKEIELYPLRTISAYKGLGDHLGPHCLVIEDEVDVVDEYYEAWNSVFDELYGRIHYLSFVTFNDEEERHQHLHYLSVLKYRGAYDLSNDLREKLRDGWRTMVFTKDPEEMKNIFEEHKVAYTTDLHASKITSPGVYLIEVEKEDVFPHAFQNPELKLALLSDREVSTIKEEKKKYFNQKVYLDFLTSLKNNDYVVHSDYGIARFLGLEKKTIDEITREYLKLGYAENDKLFVPIDQADKVNKFIGADEVVPHLTRLGSAEWNTITHKVKKETEIIAKELLALYAQRKSASGFAFKHDNQAQRRFEETFPYEETPGQMKAIVDVKQDMEKEIPMDRLVCGDVGFGKTEVAMRAAFKAVQNKRQVALISPITILADQHFRSFKKRMEEFDVRIEMLSRFKSASEQKKIVKALERGEVDIVIGTHRLLQPDVQFKNLGLIIIDEEQRFGVKQKEALKQLRTEVDVLTLTATPIPRTLNIALNKLRDISTITTPPPGRLPVITEVRRFSNGIIREAILREVERGGQVYFLHNRVQTIDGMAEKLRSLVPEARFGVAHGKLGSSDLEDRIIAFKEHQFDVLVSSTIIENGIDLANANTLIVNNADRFGLAQLYQLRGRVGRSKTQAYAYFLYHGQRLKLSAKKRLRAIVEATELGSGFQIAMKDLEIRGAGDILGAKQHGVINVVGVSHFIRMLNKAVEDLKAGKLTQHGEEGPEDVSIELPLTAYIPDNYIVSAKEKINVYQKLSSVDNMEYLEEIREELIEDYGKLPQEVSNLFHVIEFKILAKKAGIAAVKAESVYLSKGKEIVLLMSGKVKPENIMNLLEHNPKWMISGNKLRIKIEDLTTQWIEMLKSCLEWLAGSIKVDEKSPPKKS